MAADVVFGPSILQVRDFAQSEPLLREILIVNIDRKTGEMVSIAMS